MLTVIVDKLILCYVCENLKAVTAFTLSLLSSSVMQHIIGLVTQNVCAPSVAKFIFAIPISVRSG